MKESLLNDIKKLLASEVWHNRYNALSILKEEMHSNKKPKDLEVLWVFIKMGLVDMQGNVRNNAFYTFKRFRGTFAVFDSHFDLDILQGLYGLARNEKNQKIKNNLLRSIVEMNCIALEFKAKDCGLFEEYIKIMEYASKETGGKYGKQKDKKMLLLEQLGRSVMTYIKLRGNLKIKS